MHTGAIKLTGAADWAACPSRSWACRAPGMYTQRQSHPSGWPESYLWGRHGDGCCPQSLGWICPLTRFLLPVRSETGLQAPARQHQRRGHQRGTSVSLREKIVTYGHSLKEWIDWLPFRVVLDARKLELRGRPALPLVRPKQLVYEDALPFRNWHVCGAQLLAPHVELCAAV